MVGARPTINFGCPRFTIPGTGIRTIGCGILVESPVPARVLQELWDKGHHIGVGKEDSATMGRGAAVVHDSERSVNFAAADPRADGSAERQPLQ